MLPAWFLDLLHWKHRHCWSVVMSLTHEPTPSPLVGTSRVRTVGTLRIPAVAAIVLITASLLPVAGAKTLVVGAGILEGPLQGDLPTGNDTIELNVGSAFGDRWRFVFTSVWTNDNETWPYNVALAQYGTIEQLLRAENRNVSVMALDASGPWFVFIDTNYTKAAIHLEGEDPRLFFEVDRSAVAVSYDSRWPTVIFWCEPDCPNVRYAVAQVLMQVAHARVDAERIQDDVQTQLLDLDRTTNLSMDPAEASVALEKARGIRGLAAEYSRVVHGGPQLYSDLWRYPAELRAPFEDHFARMDAQEGPGWNATIERLDALEDRISTAREVGAFEKQIAQSDRAIRDARDVALTVAILGAIVAIAVGLFPMLWDARQSGARRRSMLSGLATELRKNVDYVQSILSTLEHADALFAPLPPQLNNYTPVPLDDTAYLLTATSPDAKLEESGELRLVLIQAYELLRAIREIQRQAGNLSSMSDETARERAHSMLAGRRDAMRALQALLTDAAERLRDAGILSGLEAAPDDAGAATSGTWWGRARTHSPLAVILAVSLVLTYAYWRPLLGSILILTVLSLGLSFFWRRSIIEHVQKRWTLFIAKRRGERLAYLARPKPLARHESLLLVYVSASAALLAGVTIAQFYEWRGDTTISFQVRAITMSAIASPFTTAFSLSAWMAASSRLRTVDRVTTENDDVSAVFPVNILTPLGFIPFLWAILSVPITYPVTLPHVLEAGFTGSLAIVGAFIPALAVGYAYAVIGVDEDGARLRRATSAEPVARFADIREIAPHPPGEAPTEEP